MEFDMKAKLLIAAGNVRGFARPAKTLTLIAVASVVGLSVIQNANAASLLVNGGFEDPVQGPPNYASFNLPAGNTTITGWTIVQGNVDLTTSANYGPGVNTLDPSSKQDVDLIGDSNGSNRIFGGIQQSFATVAGQTYRLTFDYSHNSGTASPSGAYVATVTVADGHSASNLLSNSVSQNNGTAIWQAFSEDFTATSDTSVLTFIDTQGGFNAGIYLDDVSVDPVNVSATPLPAALPLFASGLGALGVFGWRRKRVAQSSAA
jgi:hypothetical protein